MVTIATVLITTSQYGILLERSVLGLSPKLRYFPEDRDGGIFTETPFLILVVTCSLVVLPLAEAIDGFPWSWRRTLKQAAFILFWFWAWVIAVSASDWRGRLVTGVDLADSLIDALHSAIISYIYIPD